MRILYLLLNPNGEETYRQILAGNLPSDRMYGIAELRRFGYDVSFRCMRPRGKLVGHLNKKFGLNFTDLTTLLSLRNYDIIVVNGPISTVVTVACRLFNKKIVYLDCILRLPKNKIRKLVYKFNITSSSGTIMYTKNQIDECTEVLGVSSMCFKLLPFCIDSSFYQQFTSGKKSSSPFLLSVGRDQARDYKTLVEAIEGLEVNAKLVTLPYLLKDVSIHGDWIEVLENVSYEDLYHLYAEALFVIIPLKKWGTAYSSGTRALLEAMALGKCVIATGSKSLKEYFGQDDGVLYVEAENVAELRKAVARLLGDQNERVKLEMRGREALVEKYDMEVFGSAFGNYLSGLYSG